MISDNLLRLNRHSLEQDRSRLGITSPADFGLPAAQDLVVSNAGKQLSAWFFPNNRPCATLFLHSQGNTRYSMLKYAPIFWQRGCSLMFYDARAHGSSSTGLVTYGYYESQDAIAMLNQLKALTGFGDSQIGMIGESYGAVTAILAAENVPDLAFVIADSAFESLVTLAQERANQLYGPLSSLFMPTAFVMTEIRARFKVKQTSALDSVERLKVPLLLVHSLKDSYIPASHSHNLFASSDKSQTMLYISDWGESHGGSLNANPHEYTALINEFLAAYAAAF